MLARQNVWMTRNLAAAAKTQPYELRTRPHNLTLTRKSYDNFNFISRVMFYDVFWLLPTDCICVVAVRFDIALNKHVCMYGTVVLDTLIDSLLIWGQKGQGSKAQGQRAKIVKAPCRGFGDGWPSVWYVTQSNLAIPVGVDLHLYTVRFPSSFTRHLANSVLISF